MHCCPFSEVSAPFRGRLRYQRPARPSAPPGKETAEPYEGHTMQRLYERSALSICALALSVLAIHAVTENAQAKTAWSSVAPDGTAAIEFLDPAGAVIKTITPDSKN